MDENSPVYENFLNKMRGSKPISGIRTNISAEKLVGRPEPKTTKISSTSLLGVDEKITTMTRLVVSIADTLKRQEKLDLDILKFERQRTERRKRKNRENLLENKKPFGIFTGIVNTIAKPIQSLFSQVFGFFKELFFGRIAIGLLNFIGKFNSNDIADFMTFLGRSLPTIIGTLAVLSGLMAATLAVMSLKFIPALIAGTAAMIKANPTAAIGALTGGAIGMTVFQNIMNRPDGSVDIPGASLLPRSNVFGNKSSSISGNNNDTKTIVKKDNNNSSSTLGLSGGGRIPGSGNSDSVPSMLTPGEFVMSKGAVEKFGSGTLSAMNAMGGGTNVPMLNVGGTNIALGNGGSVPNIRMANGGMMPEIGPLDFSVDNSVASETITTANIQNSGNSINPKKSNLNVPQITLLGADPNKTSVLSATTVA